MAVLNDVQSDAPSCSEYIDGMAITYRGGFKRQKQEYKINQDAIDQLAKISEDYTIVIIFGDLAFLLCACHIREISKSVSEVLR